MVFVGHLFVTSHKAHCSLQLDAALSQIQSLVVLCDVASLKRSCKQEQKKKDVRSSSGPLDHYGPPLPQSIGSTL